MTKIAQQKKLAQFNGRSDEKCSHKEQECIPVGRVPSTAVAICGERGGGGVCLGRRLPDTPLCTEFLTHACENITFPQLCLRFVMNR